MAKILEDASGAIKGLAWSGPLLAAGGSDQKVRIYNAAQDNATCRLASYSNSAPTL